MLKATDVAPEPFSFHRLLIILLVAGVASALAVVLVRVLRKEHS
jgi:cell division protein FtsL